MKTRTTYRKIFMAIFCLLFFSAPLFAQVRAGQNRPPAATQTAAPIPVRQVSGVVLDPDGQPVPGAAVYLTSTADTLKMSTNEDGIFIFKNVKSWVFTVKVTSIGLITKVVSGKYNDATERLTLDPIQLKPDEKAVEGVTINGTPTVVYKTDTVEYKASDYVVRAGATVDELIQKMGAEVANDGTVTYNGTNVAKARLNGKDIYGGDVATTIQNLPADIVEKIQFVDDYGNTANRTGIKDGDPTKVLNITTKEEKSIGNMARLNGGIGTLDQKEGSANLTRINKNQTLTVNTTYSKTPNGIAGGLSSVGRLGGAQNRGGRSGSGVGGGAGGGASGGTNTRVLPTFTYRDQFSKKFDFLANYSYRYTDNDALTNSASSDVSTLGQTYTLRNGNNISTTKSHTLSFEMEYSIDSSNYIQFTPNINFNNTVSGNISTNFQSGFIHQDQYNQSNSTSSSPNIGATLAYQHIWQNNKARSFALEATIGRTKNDNGSEQNDNIIEYQGSSDVVKSETPVHRLINTDNLQKNLRASLTYAEPLTKTSRLEFNSNIEHRGYDNSKITSDVDPSGNANVNDLLSNIYNYTFTQYRNSLNYKYGANNSKYSFSLGLTAVNTDLVGTQVSRGSETDQSYFKLIPIARFQLRLSSTHRIAINYSGTASEPSFSQIQPIIDVTNPLRPVVGNPNLKVAFTHSINGQYSNYIANSKINYDIRLRSSFIENQVGTNLVNAVNSDGNNVRETRYINFNGNRSNGLDYTISKQLSDRKYNLNFTGNVENSHRISMSNGVLNTTDTWGFKESFGPRLTPNSWLELNPYVSYDYNKTTYSLPGTSDVIQKIWALSVDGNAYINKNLQFGYAISKNFVSGIGNNVTNNPFIINTMLQLKAFKNKGSIQLRAYDLLNQNNFVNRTQDALSYTDVLTNPKSRYIMLNLSMNIQKWTGAMGRNGGNIRRRGDGSFMN